MNVMGRPLESVNTYYSSLSHEQLSGSTCQECKGQSSQPHVERLTVMGAHENKGGAARMHTALNIILARSPGFDRWKPKLERPDESHSEGLAVEEFAKDCLLCRLVFGDWLADPCCIHEMLHTNIFAGYISAPGATPLGISA